MAEYEKCPQCGGVMHISHDVLIKEEYTAICERCGRYTTHRLRKNTDGSIWTDRVNDELVREIQVEAEEGRGAYQLCHKDESCARVGYVPKGVSKFTYRKEFMPKFWNENNIQQNSYLTWWNDGTNALELIAGEHMPPSYEEFMETMKKLEEDDNAVDEITDNTVYVLHGAYFEDKYAAGVFTTKERAEEAKSYLINTDPYYSIKKNQEALWIEIVDLNHIIG